MFDKIGSFCSVIGTVIAISISLWKDINPIKAVLISLLVGAIIFIFCLFVEKILKFLNSPEENKTKIPYTPRTPVTSPRFVGRKHLLRSLEQAFERKESISLIGDRRIGKSSLLETWKQKLEAMGRPVFLLDGQGAEGENLSAFVNGITGKQASDEPDPAANVLSDWANEEQLGTGFPPLVMVDDAEHIIRNFPPRFFERVRGTVSEKRILWIFSLRQDIDLIYKAVNDKASPFENLLHIRRVGLLDRQAAEEIIGWGNFGKNRADLMWVWAGRHPFYLHLMGQHLMNEKKVNVALDHFCSEAQSRLRELWNNLDSKEQEELKRHVSGTPSDRRSLRMRGVITKDGELFGKVLEEWLREQFPVP